MIPSMIVAMAFGRPGLNTLLVASQVVLSIVLPFVAFPLIYLTSSKAIMSVNVPRAALEANDPTDQTPKIDPTGSVRQEPSSAVPSEHPEIVAEEAKIIAIGMPASICNSDSNTVNFSNGYIVTTVAYMMWLVISVANVYGIVALG